MLYDSRTYRLLLVSSSDSFNSSFEELLPKSSYYIMDTADSIDSAKKALNRIRYDFVVINSSLNDESALAYAAELGRRRDMVCLYIARQAERDYAYSKLVASGVFSLAKPISADILNMAFRWMETAREHIRSRKNESTHKLLETDETVLREAKMKLMREKSMSEEEAYRYIRQQAMDNSLSKAEIAERILTDE